MINVYLSNADDSARDNVYKIFGSVNIPKHLIKIIDAEKEEYDIQGLCNVAFGKKTILTAIKSYAKAGIIEINRYNGKPLIDEDNGFFFYGIPMDMSDVMKTDENKFYVFELIQDLTETYLKWNPFNDEVPFGSNEPEAKASSDIIKDAEAAIVDTKYAIGIEGVSTVELMEKLVSLVDFSDTGLGKSLSKFEKISFETTSGHVFNVFPTAAGAGSQDAENEINITYKDLLSLLKVVLITGSRTINFTK